jgi:hypothetical protein
MGAMTGLHRILTNALRRNRFNCGMLFSSYAENIHFALLWKD